MAASRFFYAWFNFAELTVFVNSGASYNVVRHGETGKNWGFVCCSRNPGIMIHQRWKPGRGALGLRPKRIPFYGTEIEVVGVE